MDAVLTVAVFMGVLSLGCCRCFSCHTWHVPTCRTPPGEGGVARCKGGGLPTLGEGAEGGTERRSAAEVCTSEARKIGEALAPREGSALRKVWFPYSRSRERMILGVSVAGSDRARNEE